MNTEELSVISHADGKTISMVGDTYRIVIDGEKTNGKYSLVDMLIPKGGGPGPHSHKDTQEAFYVIEGEIEVTTKEGTHTAKAGDYVNIPAADIAHKFTNKKEETAHILCMLTPAGMEKMFAELGTPVAPGEFLPKPEMTPDLIEKFEKVGKEYGQKMYPPDYLG